MKPETLKLKPGGLPPSGRGPVGKRKVEGEVERRRRLEQARQRLREMAEIPDDPDYPPEEEWTRGIDEMRPHRPVFEWMRLSHAR